MTATELASSKHMSQIQAPSIPGGVWLAIAGLGMAAFYWAGLASLPVAWSRPEYSHGYFIPLVAAFLFLRRLRTVESPASPHDWVGMGVVLAGLTVGAIGNLARIPDLVTYGLLICAAGFVLLALGVRAGAKLWAPIVYLAFMLPLPNFLYWQLSTKLQTISSQIGTSILSFIGVPVYLDGNIIDLGIYQLQVAEACSGLNYLFPLMSFGFLFAVLYRGPAWQKVFLFLSTVPITVAMNSARIAVIGLLVDRYGIEQAEGFLHAFEGWVIFVACLAVLFAEGYLLRLLIRGRGPKHGMLDLNTDGLLAQARRVARASSSRQFAAASLLVAAAGLAWHLAPDPAVATPPREPLTLFPIELGAWSGVSGILQPETEQVLAADDYLVADYRNDDEESPVNLFVAFYASQIAGSGIHSPEVCIPAGGWEVSRWASTQSPFRLPSGEALDVNRAVIQKGFERQLVYYWFEQRGEPMTSAVAAKIDTVWDSVVRGRTDGALVRLVTPIGRDEPLVEADERLARFLTQAYPTLARFVPA